MRGRWAALLALAAYLLSGGAPISAQGEAAPASPGTEDPPLENVEQYNAHTTGDPFENVNRTFFEVNLFLDDVILEPTAKAYRWVVPKPGRRSISNFLNNLDSPAILANDILQQEWKRAGTTTARFGINSTLGLLGLFDPAMRFGLTRHSEDFGQTLAVHGTGSGPYLMVPFLGSSNPRDLFGRGVDILFNPLTWMGGNHIDEIQIALFAANVVTSREAIIETFDEIERTSIDLYSQTRSIYNQQRESEIKNGRDDFSDLPDLSEFDTE